MVPFLFSPATDFKGIFDDQGYPISKVAAKINQRPDRSLSELVEFRAVTGIYRPADYFVHGVRGPSAETVHASHRIERD